MPRSPSFHALVCALGALLFVSGLTAFNGVSKLGLVVSEIMYQPAPPSPAEREAGFTSADAFEYLEITNTAAGSLELKDLTLEGSISFHFASATRDHLDPGETALLVSDSAAFAFRYGAGLPVLGTFAGDLPDLGGPLTLTTNEDGTRDLDILYGTGNLWPKTPRGMGFSLVLRDPEKNPDHNVPTAWRASAQIGGSPGFEDPEPAHLPIYINEIRPKTAILDTYFRETRYPATPDAAPSAFVNLYVQDMRANPYHFSFLHLVGPDLVGHASGWASPAQDDSIRAVDVDLGQVLQLVDTDLVLQGKTAIIVTADHGGGGGQLTHHIDIEYPLNFTISFHAWGPGIPAGADLYQLNQATRTLPDPELNPAYAPDTASMPIRNGGLGNLAADLLGLPAIPGSWINHDQTLHVGADRSSIDYVIAISIDGLRPDSIVRLGPEELPNLHRLRREGAFTDAARTDVDYTLTNPNHSSMLTSRGTLDQPGVGQGHNVTFNSSVSATLESWNGAYIASVFDMVKSAGQSTAFYSNKAKLDFLGRSYGAIGADAIELHNPNDVAVNVGGWHLTDDPTAPTKFRLPNNTSVPAHGYLVLAGDPLSRSPQRPSPTTNFFGSAFSLEPSGGELHLFGTSNGILNGFDHGIAFDPLLHGTTLARQSSPEGERFYTPGRSTIGGDNLVHAASPLVITEVSTEPGEAFVELRNTSADVVSTNALWSLSGHVQFTFPGDIVIPPNHYLLAAENPAALSPLVPESAQVLGPLRVDPSNQTGPAEIEIALNWQQTDLLGVPRQVSLDRVVLARRGDWPDPPPGHTWERRGHRSFAGTPLNWRSSEAPGGSPGMATHGSYEVWSQRWLANAGPDQREADADPDGDGLTNFHEYGFATDPLDPASFFQPIFQWTPSRGLPTLTFQRPIDSTDLLYLTEASTDLLTWKGTTIDVVELAERVILQGNDNQDRVEVTLAIPAWNGARFVRLQVVRSD